MISDHLSCYNLAIHPSLINVYYESLSGSTRRPLPGERPESFKSNLHQGKISPIARKKITRSIDYLIFLSKPKKLPPTLHGKNYKFNLNFITLTLSSAQVHPDQEITSKLLHQFLIEMCRKWKVDNYVWRAEKQVNGNIHYHIVTGNFIPWNELRNTWNRIQQKLGYVTRYREARIRYHEHGFKVDNAKLATWSYAKQLKAYKVGCLSHWDNPNSTDVHSIRDVRDIKAYFIKYMTKNDNIADIGGRLWGCSVSLSNLDGGHCIMDSLVKEELDRIVASGKCKVYHDDFYSCFHITIALLHELNCVHILKAFTSYMQHKFPNHCPPGLF